MDTMEMLRRLADPAPGTRHPSRREALRTSALAGAGLALASSPLAFAGTPRRLAAQGTVPNRVINALNFALTLEYLESEFYNLGMDASGLIPAGDREVFGQIAKHENAHVAFLSGALGAKAALRPTFDFTAGGTLPTFTDYPTFLLISQAFEDTGVRAYKGRAVDLIVSDAYLTAALRIHSVEARHACEVRRIRGEEGWINGDESDDSAIPPPFQPVYAGEANTIQLGVDVSTFEGTEAGTEAFDEPIVDERDVLAIIQVFVVPNT